VLQRRYGSHMVDGFASPLNARCPRFNTKTRAPGTEAVDALSVAWGGAENNWVYPPFHLADLVLAKIRADKAAAIVILPEWWAQPWWAPAVAAANEAYLLPKTAGPFTSGQGRRTPPPPWWRVAAFLFLRGGLPPAAISARQKRRARANHLRLRSNGSLGRWHGVATSGGCWRVPRPDTALMPLPLADSA